MGATLISDDLGQATITPPEPVPAGALCTIALVYTVGHPIDDSGSIKIVFRYAGDFGSPQFDRPDGLDFCSVTTTGRCSIVPSWVEPGHVRPWGKSLFLRVTGGYLDRGDRVRVLFGDTSAGSPGWRMQTFSESTFEFKTLVDPIATYQFKELSRSPTLRIVPAAPARATCIAPSQVKVGEAFDFHVRLEDEWGNPTATPTRHLHPGFESPGVRWIDLTEPGTDLTCTSNPIEVVQKARRTRPCWADLHGQSEEAIGTNTIEDYFSFARDMALLDIAGHQANDFQITDEFWQTIKLAADRYTEPGRFVTFPGYEWSGSTPLGGDRNVYLMSGAGRLSRSSNELLPSGRSRYPVSPTAEHLFDHLRRQRTRAFSIAHVGGRYADLRMHDREMEVAVEVHSAWGTFEWFVEEAFRLGCRVGINAGSDDHKGRPGASHPGRSRFGSYGGLTCVLASALTRESIYHALRSRHFYATTGVRCLIDVELVGPDGTRAIMGDVVTAWGTPMVLEGRVWGAGALEGVDVRNGSRTIGQVRPYTAADLGRRIKVVWRGAEVRGRARQTDWSGALLVESNGIRRVQPVQFWNPHQMPRLIDEHQVAWESSTSGGLAGCILELEDRDNGTITIRTAQGECSWPIASIGLTPLTRQYGGVGKQLEIFRLPDAPAARHLSFEIPLDDLSPGDNPIYVRMSQEDGHMAWSSPIYVVSPSGHL